MISMAFEQTDNPRTEPTTIAHINIRFISAAMKQSRINEAICSAPPRLAEIVGLAFVAPLILAWN
jgi:hypothetical protein